jgi:NAD(P)-dependent dehydrogenase (short-subunit alcohol dehydrogenase family)
MATERTAIISGGGSGVGRATAMRLAREGWRVAILGRRLEPLQATAALAAAGRIHPEVCDVTDSEAVDRTRDRVLAAFGDVDVLVSAAGTNVQRRALGELSVEDFRALIDTNLVGTFHLVHAFLPAMRRQGHGTIVAIASDVGLIASAKAGAGYVASKFGMVGFVESLNAELRQHGIRASVICPGDINTPLLDKRPVPPTAEARAAMLQPDDIVECIMLAVTLPHRAVVEKLVVRPR